MGACVSSELAPDQRASAQPQQQKWNPQLAEQLAAGKPGDPHRDSGAPRLSGASCASSRAPSSLIKAGSRAQSVSDGGASTSDDPCGGGADVGPSGAHMDQLAPRLGSRVGSITLRGRSSARAQLQMEFLSEVHGLQQQLALVNDNPVLGLQEAAELVAAQMGADLAAIWVAPKDDPACSVLMAAHGDGAGMLQRCVVARAGDGGCGLGPLGQPRALCIHDAAEPQAGEAPLPEDLWSGPEGLRSFVQVPIGALAAPMGALLLAKRDPGAFAGTWWQVRLHVASTGLLPHVRHAQVEQMAGLLKAMDATQDPVALISVLLRSASRYMLRTCSMRMSARLALLQTDGSGKALLFEAGGASAAASSGRAGAGAAAPAPGSPRAKLVADADAAADVIASNISLQNTLLASAVSKQQARFISDCGAYMQTCVRPARDLFTRSADLVASVVVVPLIAGGAPLGALYFAADTPVEFTNVQDTLLGFIHGVTPMLHNKLAGRADLLAAMVAKAARRTSLVALTDGSSRDASHPLASVAELPSSSSGGNSAGAGGGANAAAPPACVSSRLSKVGSGQRLNTDAMLQVLQQQIRSKHRAGGGSLTGAPELTVGEVLGRGGFGAVYRGRWHRVPVAVKVMPSRASEREAMQDAVEMAVLSSVQHPNIVSVYSCLTDMVEASDADNSLSFSGAGSGSASGAFRTRYRRLRPDEDPDGEEQTFNVVVMEYCDHGTLRDAVRAGMLHQQLPSGAIGVDLASVVEILLDVAYALQYLHSMQLVHGDIKLENILLKSDPSRRLGVTPKLADFGLTKILNEADHTVNLDGAGTVTHLAPEMFKAGSRVTKAVDSYAFGIFMWEVYTSKRAYSGLPREAIIERVYRGGMRPRFPSSAPRAFAGLAEACWASDPAQRPAFGEIAERLEALAAELAAPPAELAAAAVAMPATPYPHPQQQQQQQQQAAPQQLAQQLQQQQLAALAAAAQQQQRQAAAASAAAAAAAPRAAA